MSETQGVKEFEEVIDLALGMIEAGAAIAKIGKISIEDVPVLVKVLPLVGPALDGLEKVPGELSDLSESEAGEVVTHVMAKLAVGDEKAKEVVGAGLKVLVAVHALYKAVKV